jgi:hypothetical protein
VAFVVVVATALVSYFVLRFSAFAPAPVAGFDELVSRVDRAAAAGHVFAKPAIQIISAILPAASCTANPRLNA